MKILIRSSLFSTYSKDDIYSTFYDNPREIHQDVSRCYFGSNNFKTQAVTVFCVWLERKNN